MQFDATQLGQMVFESIKRTPLEDIGRTCAIFYHIGELDRIEAIIERLSDLDNFKIEDFDSGYELGYGEGSCSGHEEGYEDGFDDGYEEGIVGGRELGYEEGYQEGFNEGYEQGAEDARS